MGIVKQALTPRVGLKMTLVVSVATGVGMVLLTLAGATSFAVMGLYAAVPLLCMPVIYRSVTTESGSSVRDWEIPMRLLVGLDLLALALAISLSTRQPRPDAFFAALAITYILCLLLAVSDGHGMISLALLSATNAVFHLSSTLAKGFYFSSGDIFGHWVSVKNAIAMGDLTHLGSYNWFPNLYALILALGKLAGVNAETAMFVTGACTFVLTPWFVAYLARRIGVVSPRFVAVPAVLLSLSYQYYYMGLYSLPRSVFSQFAIVPLALVLGVVARPARLTDRRRLLLAIYLISLLWYHKVGPLLFTAILMLFVVTAFVLQANGGGVPGSGVATSVEGLVDRSKEIQRTVTRLGIPVRTLFLVFPLSSLYLVIQSGELRFALRMVTRLSSLTEMSSSSIALAAPLGMLSTFAGSSVLLILFIAGVFTVSTKKGELWWYARWFVLPTVVLAPFYFPGPIHASQALMDGLGISRIAEFAYPFVILVAAVGFVRLWTTRSDAVRVLLVVLVLTGAGLNLANDIYTRDNPIVQSGTPSNYFTPSEQRAVEFTLSHEGTVLTDTEVRRYAVFRKELATGWGGRTPMRLASVGNRSEMCRSSILIRQGEIRRRGQLIFPFGENLQTSGLLLQNVRYHRVHSSEGIPMVRSRPVVYDGGNTRLLLGGQRCSNTTTGR